MYENIYNGIDLINAEDAKRESDNKELIDRRTEMGGIMGEIQDTVCRGGHNVKVWIKFDSTVNKLLELGYELSNKNTMESITKMHKPGDRYAWGGLSDQTIISW